MKIPTRNEVLVEVRAICKSGRFARAPRCKEVLRYLVKTTLKDPLRNPCIKGVQIGIEVFKLPADFDPHKNTQVKVTIKTLRELLTKYYENEGHHNRFIAKFGRGYYVPNL